MGFEPMSPLSQAKRLAGARTRPLCDPSLAAYMLSNGLKRSNTHTGLGLGRMMVWVKWRNTGGGESRFVGYLRVWSDEFCNFDD